MSIRYDESNVIQQRMPLVAEEIQMEEGRIVGVPVEEWPVDADGVVVEPAVSCVEMEPVECALRRGIGQDLLIGLEETWIADA